MKCVNWCKENVLIHYSHALLK
uniref:Uncharacterized protein n=1 Tax=Anguilla anguilla TaxID=7936 RepID=A0A0E9T3P5_ANGAN